MDKASDPAEWRLDALAGKMVQYCPLLQGLTGDDLRTAANVRTCSTGFTVFEFFGHC